MNDKLPQQYLELLKKSLTFTLWSPEPGIPMDILRGLNKCLKYFTMSLTYGSGNLTQEHREEGRPYFSVYADTMIGIKRLNNLQCCVEGVLEKNVSGDFIETGVWRGGACIFMRGILEAHGSKDRKVYVADSFQGLPEPDDEKYIADKGTTFHKNPLLAVSINQVKRNFERYGLLDEQVVFLQGWFKDTLPVAPIDKLAILRLDGDMYSSTIEALEALYPKLSIGGFCIVDDYGALPACKLAVDDYRHRNHISEKIKGIDWTGIYWEKTA
jgi:hypothetical protein